MELISIVDKNGNFTGEILERVLAHDKNLLHNEVGCFILNDKKELLLQKRSANKRYGPNKWAICAGHVLANESLDNAMVREIKEEIGIDITTDKLHRYGDKVVNIREKNSNITYFYYAIININHFTIQKEELSEVKWFTIDGVISMIINSDNIVFKKDKIELINNLKNI